MGSKTVTNETKIPPPTEEERQFMAQFSALIDAQLAQDYIKQESTQFVYNRQAEIDQINQKLNDPSYANYSEDLIKQRAELMQEGGYNKTNVSYQETPEAKTRRLATQKATDEVNAEFFKATKKLVSGDLSVTSKQQKQIDALIGDNFTKIMDDIKSAFSFSADEIKADAGRAESVLREDFAGAESAVNAAVNRLMESGRADLAQQFQQHSDQQKRQAELLGRSFQDTQFQKNIGEYQAGALERLYRGGQAQAANAIAGLRSNQAGTLANLYGQQNQNLAGLYGNRASSLGAISEQQGLARYNLGLQAAQPLAAFGSGAQFAQLQGALQAQNLANSYMPINSIQQQLGQLGNLRAAQPTTTQTQPFGVLDVLGTLAGIGGTAMTGLSTFGVIGK